MAQREREAAARAAPRRGPDGEFLPTSPEPPPAAGGAGEAGPGDGRGREPGQAMVLVEGQVTCP